MAVTEIETRIANPAKRRGRKKNMARKMSAKQLKYFGSKRQKAAARAGRKRKNKAKRRASHRPRSKPRKQNRGSVLSMGTPRKKRRRNRKSGSAKKARARKSTKRRKNTGAIYALVNPARKKGKNSMARSRKRKRQRTNPAGRKSRRKNRGGRRRGNPGGLPRPMDWVSLGAGAIVGGLAASALPQAILGSGNTGVVGYLGMAAATAIVAIAEHMLLKNPMLVSGTVAGGAGALIKRVIGDMTPFGSYLNANAGASGMGDYLSNWNFPVPAIIGGNGNTALGAPGQTPVNVAGAGAGSRFALSNV